MIYTEFEKFQGHMLLTITDEDLDIVYCNFDIIEEKIFVNFIWVEHSKRLRGFGLETLKALQDEYPEKTIDGDFITPGGIKLIEKFRHDRRK